MNASGLSASGGLVRRALVFTVFWFGMMQHYNVRYIPYSKRHSSRRLTSNAKH
jgi:hypothetical protein